MRIDPSSTSDGPYAKSVRKSEDLKDYHDSEAGQVIRRQNKSSNSISLLQRFEIGSFAAGASATGACSSVTVARGALDATIAEFPNRIVMLRNWAQVLDGNEQRGRRKWPRC